MAPAGRRRETGKINSTTERKRKKICKKRPPLQASGNKHPAGFLFSKFMRFFSLCETLFLRRRKSTKEQGQKLDMINKTSLTKEPGEGWTQMNLETGVITNSWRDPDAKFCCICGDEEEKHVELMCPYNYLSPASYAPCRARLVFWGNETTAIRCKFRRPKEVPKPDETTLRRLKFLRCFVRVNNLPLPEQCRPEQVVSLFNRFGPLRNWHVALHNSGACRGFGYMIFQHPEQAEEAINVLNCYNFGDCKLRVDWAYPCASQNYTFFVLTVNGLCKVGYMN